MTQPLTLRDIPSSALSFPLSDAVAKRVPYRCVHQGIRSPAPEGRKTAEEGFEPIGRGRGHENGYAGPPSVWGTDWALGGARSSAWTRALGFPRNTLPTPAAAFTLASPQAQNGPTDIFFAQIGPG